MCTISICLFNKYLLIACCVSGIVLSAQDTSANKMDKDPCICETYFEVGDARDDEPMDHYILLHVRG